MSISLATLKTSQFPRHVYYEWCKYCEEDTSYLTENDYLSVLDDINTPDNGDGTTIMTDGCSFIVYIRNRHSHRDIAHEVFHAAN